jgi:phosphate transport system permease protein
MKFDRNTRRAWVNLVASGATMACVLLALIPLGSIVWTAALRGGQVLSVHFLTAPEPTGCVPGDCPIGGIGPAIEGTFVVVTLAALIAMPIGVLAGIYLSEFGRHRMGRTLSFLSDVLTGIPSIVVGAFVYALFLLYDRALVFSVISGSIALALIMIPIVTRTSEEALRLVPDSLREASLALGIPKFRTTTRVVLPSAGSALLTGAVLAVMRGGGETAPLILTLFGSRFGFSGLTQPGGALPLTIFYSGNNPASNQVADAWGAALVLILIMLGISLVARVILRRRLA